MCGGLPRTSDLDTMGPRHIVLRQLAVSGQRVLRAHGKADGEASNKANVPPGSFPFHNQISTML